MGPNYQPFGAVWVGPMMMDAADICYLRDRLVVGVSCAAAAEVVFSRFIVATEVGVLRYLLNAVDIVFVRRRSWTAIRSSSRPCCRWRTDCDDEFLMIS